MPFSKVLKEHLPEVLVFNWEQEEKYVLEFHYLYHILKISEIRHRQKYLLWIPPHHMALIILWIVSLDRGIALILQCVQVALYLANNDFSYEGVANEKVFGYF